MENQEKFQVMLDAQQSQISTIMAKFISQPEETIKDKGKANDEFYQVSIYHFLRQFFNVIFTYNYLHYRMPLEN